VLEDERDREGVAIPLRPGIPETLALPGVAMVQIERYTRDAHRDRSLGKSMI
jgi:hypothetical protein